MNPGRLVAACIGLAITIMVLDRCAATDRPAAPCIGRIVSYTQRSGRAPVPDIDCTRPPTEFPSIPGVDVPLYWSPT